MIRDLSWNVLLRAALSSIAFVILLVPVSVLAGGFVPDAPWVGRLGALLNEGIGWVSMGALTAILLSGLAVWLGGRRFTAVLLAAAILANVGAGVVAWQYTTLAESHGATFDLLRTLAPAPASRHADAYVTFNLADGESLRVGLWRARAGSPGGALGPVAAIVYVHGGAFVGGGLDMRPALFDALASQRVAVVDVGYRLAPPPRWQDAPGDVLCALAWLRTTATQEGIDAGRVVVMGESAGGSLALLAAYAAGTDLLPSSCPGDPIVPAGVIAVAPAADLAGIWEDATLTAAGLRFPEAYVGGPPGEYPDRYELASPFRLMRADLPPTLLVAAGNDHLVRLPRVKSIADALKAAGADYRLLVVPFVDHGFDGVPNSFGAQLEESIVRTFIEQVSP